MSPGPICSGRGIPRYSHSGNGPSPIDEVRQVKLGLWWGRIQGDIPGRHQADIMFVEAPDGKDDHRKVGKHRGRPAFVVASWILGSTILPKESTKTMEGPAGSSHLPVK